MSQRTRPLENIGIGQQKKDGRKAAEMGKSFEIASYLRKKGMGITEIPAKSRTFLKKCHQSAKSQTGYNQFSH